MKKISIKIIGVCLIICALFSALGVSSFADFSGEKDESGGGVKLASRFYSLLFAKDEETMLYPGGFTIGILIDEGEISVSSPSFDKKLCIGDKILRVNGKAVKDCDEVLEMILDSRGAAMTFDISRAGRELSVVITPRLKEGKYSIGATLRSCTAGIGTVTYVDPASGEFGALGHGVCTSEGTEPVPLKSAHALTVALGGIKRGERGKAGELCGVLKREKLGMIYTNCECGVFGRFNAIPANLKKPLPVCKKCNVHEGDAEIISTVKNGLTASYKITIEDIDVESCGSKSFKIKVTDDTLLSLTGGIVRGMSGSPIIQDGKLVGAVTHVMVADPTEGYGIFIENMLNAAESQVQPKVA